MRTKWLIENFHEDNGYLLLANEVIKQGMDCQIVNTNEYPLKINLEKYSIDDCVIIQSSFQFADGILRYKDLSPCRFFTPENYKCTNYYKYFGDSLFNNEYVIMTRAEVKRKIDFLERILGEKESGRIFIRPDSGMKSFTGMVFINRKEYFDNDWGFVENSTDPNDLLIISSPKTIVEEYRFVIINGYVVTGSLYKRDYDTVFETLNNETHIDLFTFAQDMAELYQPDITYTLDIVKTCSGELKLLEINSFSHAGLYKCDMSKIVKEVSILAERMK